MTKVDGQDFPKGVVEAIVLAVKYFDEQYENRVEIAKEIKDTPKRGFPTLSSLLPPVKLKHSGSKSPQTREKTHLPLSLSTSNNDIF